MSTKTTSPEPAAAAARTGIFGRMASWSPTSPLGRAAAVGRDRLAGITAGSRVAGSAYHNDFSLPGTESQAASDLMEEHGSLQAGATFQIVLKDAGGLDAGDPGIRAMLDEVRSLPSVADVQPPGEGSVSPDGTIGYATVTLDGVAEDVPREHVTKIIDTAQAAAGDGLQVELGGDPVRNVQEEGGGGRGRGHAGRAGHPGPPVRLAHRRGGAAGHRVVRGRLARSA